MQLCCSANQRLIDDARSAPSLPKLRSSGSADSCPLQNHLPLKLCNASYSSHLTRCRCVWCFLGYYPRFCCGGGMSCCIIFTGALE